MGVVWVPAKDESQLQSASSPLDGLQAKKWGICRWLCNKSTHSSPEMWIWREWIGERIIEFMIASTQIEAFQRELLGKAKGYKLTDAFAEGRRFGGILEGRQEIQKRTSTSLNNVDQVGQACGNCGRAHHRRACPTYKDSCKFCGKIVHWKIFFPKTQRNKTVRRKMVNNVGTPNRMANNIGMLAKAAVGETEDFMIWSQQPVTLQRKTPLSPMTAYAYPVYATRFSQHWMLSALEKRACARSNSRSTLELRGTHSLLGHTSRCTRHSPQKTSLSPQGTSSWLPTMVRRSLV